MIIEDGIISSDIAFKVLALLILVPASFQDIREKRISVYYILAGAGLSMCYVVYMLLFEEAELLSLCIGLIPGAALLMISLVTSGGLGMGDGLMALCLGPVFGASMMSAALFAGFFLCSISSLILLIFRIG